MDAQHRADLERILANKRAGGRLKHPPPSGSSTSGRGNPTGSEPASPFAATAPGVDVPQTVTADVARPVSSYLSRRTLDDPPTADTAARVGSSPSASHAEVATLRSQMAELQRRLDQGQLAQYDRMSEIHDDIRAVQQAIAGAPPAKSSSLRGERSLARSGGGMMLPIPRMVPDVGTPSAHGGGQGNFRTRGDEPRVVEFASRMQLNSTARPPEPPISARPYATSTIDVDTSVSLLSRGDWFLKWNSHDADVKPQYVWLDTTGYRILWGASRKAPSLFSTFIELHTMTNITTQERIDHRETEAKVYHVLVIHTVKRTLCLGTERREKLDLWYDALNNILSFYRSQQRLVRRFPSSSD